MIILEFMSNGSLDHFLVFKFIKLKYKIEKFRFLKLKLKFLK